MKRRYKKIESKPGSVTVAWGDKPDAYNAWAYEFTDDDGTSKGWIRWGQGAKATSHSKYRSYRSALKAIASRFRPSF